MASVGGLGVTKASSAGGPSSDDSLESKSESSESDDDDVSSLSSSSSSSFFQSSREPSKDRDLNDGLSTVSYTHLTLPTNREV